jgi:hypothetical protein
VRPEVSFAEKDKKKEGNERRKEKRKKKGRSWVI